MEAFQKTLQSLHALFYNLHAKRLVPDFVHGCVVCIFILWDSFNLGACQVQFGWTPQWICYGFFPKGGGKSVVLITSPVCTFHCHLDCSGVLRQHCPSSLCTLLKCQWPWSNLHQAPTPFWKELFSLQSTMLRLNTAFYPQIHGQSEVANRILGVYLRCLARNRPNSSSGQSTATMQFLSNFIVSDTLSGCSRVWASSDVIPARFVQGAGGGQTPGVLWHVFCWDMGFLLHAQEVQYDGFRWDV